MNAKIALYRKETSEFEIQLSYEMKLRLQKTWLKYASNDNNYLKIKMEKLV